MADDSVTELRAKALYVEECQSHPLYGISLYAVREFNKSKTKLKAALLGVSKDAVFRMDATSVQVLEQWPLTQVKRWGSQKQVFSLNFGDYREEYSVKTEESEKIAQLISGYINIIVKRREEKAVRGYADDGEAGEESLVMAGR